MTAPAIEPRDQSRGPTYWFVKLDLALEAGEWEEAAQAADALRAFGIDVRLTLDRVSEGRP
jgi:hypothetical protein